MASDVNRYNTGDDLRLIQALLECSEQQLAEGIGVSLMSIRRWKKDDTVISADHLRAVYDFAFKRGLRLNRIKEQLYREDASSDGRIIVFHGAKESVKGELSTGRSKGVNDFGSGFYCGENFEQSAMFVSSFPESSVYIAGFDGSADLKSARYRIDQDWMLTIAYFRHRIDAYAQHPNVIRLARRVEQSDYVVAPIADNRMYQVIDEFINGEITDIQCQHCLSATNLGMQYVFTTDRALERVNLLTRCYLAPAEKEAYRHMRQQDNKVGIDKAKVARRTYRGQGLYIDEILK